jgi:hypothetical protein
VVGSDDDECPRVESTLHFRWARIALEVQGAFGQGETPATPRTDFTFISDALEAH